ncbi:MAG TPA: hypothetical protein VF615_25560 [Longimicrobiaceae bacterium]|jgi:hypothetical protein
MSKRVRLTGLLAKIETEYGTDSLPVPGTNGIQLEEHIWSNIDVDHLEQNERKDVAGARMGRHASAQPSGRFAKLTLTVGVKGAGAAYAAATRPEMDVLLRIAGFQATVDATATSESITYVPIDEAHESATLYAYSAGSLFKVVGCRGRLVSLTSIPARICIARFEVMGLLLEDPTDVALPAIVYAGRNVKPPVSDQVVTLGTYGAPSGSFTLEFNTELPAKPRGGTPGGHAGYDIMGYDPTAKVQIDSPTKAVWNPWAIHAAGTLFAWEHAIGGSQYNRLTIAGPAARILKVPPEDQSGHAMLGIQLAMHHADPDPAVTLTFD